MFISDISKLSRQSHAKVKVKCCFEASDNCIGIKEIQYRDAMDNIDRNDGKYICLYCSRYLKASGNNNPNCQYNFDRNILENIDTPEKAYLLGWIASDGTISKDSWSIIIGIKEIDIQCLKILRNIVCESIPIKKIKENMICLTINSRKMCEDVCKHIDINRGKKSDILKFPNLQSDKLKWVFIRGYFDGDGSIRNYEKYPTPECKITSNSKEMLEAIKDFAKIPCNIYKNDIVYYGTNSIDFLGKLYDSKSYLRLERKYNQFVEWLDWRQWIKGKDNSSKLPECYIYKTDKDAIIPLKSKTSDVGYDLTIIKEEKKFMNNIILYDTGIKINVKYGLYAEVVPRSSLSKSGYILANSIGIIDNSYRGNIFIALTKINPEASDIKLPFKCCQLIFRKQVHVDIEEVVEEFDETARNEGGFGSTGN
jgi:dUTP pyrophosphatase